MRQAHEHDFAEIVKPPLIAIGSFVLGEEEMIPGRGEGLFPALSEEQVIVWRKYHKLNTLEREQKSRTDGMYNEISMITYYGGKPAENRRNQVITSCNELHGSCRKFSRKCFCTLVCSWIVWKI